MKTFLRFCVLIPLLLISSCEKKGSNPVDATPSPPLTSGGKITTGQSVDLGSQTIGTSGGTFAINKSGDPLNGFQITVPQQAFSASKTFSVSYASVTSHQYGSTFNPVSPLIKISYDGGYSDLPMKVKVPIQLPAGSYAMAFFYDEATGSLEALPTVSCDGNSITIATRHFMNLSQPPALSKRTDNPWDYLIISSNLETMLAGHAVISTGFTPGVDDWEFPNFGSYVSSKGICAGQSMSAIWYYYVQKIGWGASPLFHHFDKFNNPLDPRFCWYDNPRGYRFASTIQMDINFDDWASKALRQARHPDSVWRDFISSMLREASPQLLFAMRSSDNVAHAMIVYKIDVVQGILYVADPNYPGNVDPKSGSTSVRQIAYTPGGFLPYTTALSASQPGIAFDVIAFGGKTAYIDWSTIANRAFEFREGTIGNNIFPSYQLVAMPQGTIADVPFTDRLVVEGDHVTLRCSSTIPPLHVPGSVDEQYLTVIDAAGQLVSSTTSGNKGYVPVPLSPGSNLLGLAMFGKPEAGDSSFIDFKWVTVVNTVHLAVTTTEADQAPVATPGLSNKQYKFIAHSDRPLGTASGLQYEWDFGDGKGALDVKNDSTVAYSFLNGGTFTVNVTLTQGSEKLGQASAQVRILSSTGPLVDSVFVYCGGPGLTWGLAGWRLAAYGQNFMSGATDAPSVWIGTTKLPVISSTAHEADAIIPAMAIGSYGVSVIRQDGGASNAKSIYIGIPQSDINLHSDAYMQFTFYYTYNNAVMGRVDTMGLSEIGVYGTVAWSSNGFTITMNPVPTVDYPQYGTAAVTFSQGEANLDLSWKLLDRYRGYTPDDSIHYTAQHVRARTQGFPPLIFAGDSPEEMTRVTTQLSGIVVSRQGAHGQPITGLVPVGSSFVITIPGITR